MTTRTTRRFSYLSLSCLLILPLWACGDSSDDDPLNPGDPDDDPPALTVVGTIELLDGGAAAGSEVTGRWGEMVVRDEVADDGGFTLGLPVVPEGGGFLEIRPAPGTAAVSSLVRLDGSPPDDPVRVLLLPDRWTVRSGVHEGAVVEIHPADAADGRVMPSYWDFTFAFEQRGREQVVLDSTRWTAGLSAWPDGSFPLPVALDRENSSAPFAQSDSVRIWDALVRLEEVVGRDLFDPARYEDLPAPDPDLGDLIPGAVVVRFDSTLTVKGKAGQGGGVSTWFSRMEVGEWSGSDVTRFAAASIDARAGWIHVRDPALLEDPSLVIHEAMHVLGVGHGCTWRSVQTYCVSLATDEPTAEDVAYLEVLLAAMEREKELDTMHGIVPAVFGERALERGLPPIPDVNVVHPDEG